MVWPGLFDHGRPWSNHGQTMVMSMADHGQQMAMIDHGQNTVDHGLTIILSQEFELFELHKDITFELCNSYQELVLIIVYFEKLLQQKPTTRRVSKKVVLVVLLLFKYAMQVLTLE